MIEWFCSQVYCDVGQPGAATMWAAVISLGGALLAVSGAIAVGWRQSKILAVQAEISHRAVELEELKLRSELYDRRLEIYNAIDAMLRYVRAHKTVPGWDRNENDEVIETELSSNFWKAYGSARFLFSEETYAYIDQIFDDLSSLSDINYGIRNGAYPIEGEDPPEVQKKVMVSRILRSHVQMRDNFPELNLAAPIQSIWQRRAADRSGRSK